MRKPPYVLWVLFLLSLSLPAHAVFNVSQIFAAYTFDGANASVDDVSGLYGLTFETGVNMSGTSVDGNAIQFDGVSGYAQTPGESVFSMTDGAGNDHPFSISLWVRPDDPLAAVYTLISKDTTNPGGDGREWFFITYTGGWEYQFWDTTSGYIRRDGTADAWSNTSWHHLVMTYDGSESNTGIKVYSDGILQADTPGSSGYVTGMPDTAQRVLLGAFDDLTAGGTVGGGHDFFKGSMDEVYFARVQWNQTEVDELYNSGAGAFYPFGAVDTTPANWTDSPTTVMTLLDVPFNDSLSYIGSEDGLTVDVSSSHVTGFLDNATDEYRFVYDATVQGFEEVLFNLSNSYGYSELRLNVTVSFPPQPPLWLGQPGNVSITLYQNTTGAYVWNATNDSQVYEESLNVDGFTDNTSRTYNFTYTASVVGVETVLFNITNLDGYDELFVTFSTIAPQPPLWQSNPSTLAATTNLSLSTYLVFNSSYDALSVVVNDSHVTGALDNNLRRYNYTFLTNASGSYVVSYNISNADGSDVWVVTFTVTDPAVAPADPSGCGGNADCETLSMSGLVVSNVLVPIESAIDTFQQVMVLLAFLIIIGSIVTMLILGVRSVKFWT